MKQIFQSVYYNYAYNYIREEKMEHYFSENPKSEHRILNIKYNLGNLELNFTTDTGVFSKTKVDYGTDVLIRSLPPLHGKILDLGCGYGPIGISLAKLNPDSQITMVDINQRAVELSNQNILQNNVQNAIAYQSNGFEKVDGLFNAIVSNPPIRAGKKIYPLFERSIDFSRQGRCSIWLFKNREQNYMEKLTEIYIKSH